VQRSLGQNFKNTVLPEVPSYLVGIILHFLEFGNLPGDITIFRFFLQRSNPKKNMEPCARVDYDLACRVQRMCTMGLSESTLSPVWDIGFGLRSLSGVEVHLKGV